MNPAHPADDGDVLVVVDPQNDFCPGGALAVPGGGEIMPLVNRLARRFAHVILTQDWHPFGHARSRAAIRAGGRWRRSSSITVCRSYGPTIASRAPTGLPFTPASTFPRPSS